MEVPYDVKFNQGVQMSTYYEVVAEPTAADCTSLRTRSNLTLDEMASLVHLAERQSWWRFEAGLRGCNLAMWELALLKTNEHPSYRLVPR